MGDGSAVYLDPKERTMNVAPVNFSYEAYRLNFEFVRVRSEATAPAPTDEAVPVASETEPTPLQPATPVVQPEEEPSPLDTAREAGQRAEMGRDDGAAPGAMGFAQSIIRSVGAEAKPMARGNSGLDREQRHEIREAFHDFRKSIQSSVFEASEDEEFDLGAFAASAADAVDDFVGELADVLGIELEEPEDDEPAEEENTVAPGPVPDAPEKPDEQPVPTMDGLAV